jgi:tRNA G18 (ribose-2'-O)-methylase SpoU
MILISLGNEVDGVSPKLLRLADVIAEIPLKGKKESLNVSVAAGVALFRWFDCV